jgi:hypothetical protein
MRQFVPLGLPHRRSIDGSLPGELLLIFLNDRNQDQEKGEEANKIEEWAAFVWIIRESQRSAVYTFNQEKQRKKKWSAVSFQKRRKNNPAINEAIDIASGNMKSIRQLLNRRPNNFL